MSEDTYGIVFGIALAVCCATPLAYYLRESRKARNSFSSGNARARLPFAVMKRLAIRQYKRGQLVFVSCIGALLVIMNSRISDIGALVVAPPLFMIAGFAGGPLRRTKGLRRMLADTSDEVLSDGAHLFLVQQGRLVTWLSAPAEALAEAGVLPAARVRQ